MKFYKQTIFIVLLSFLFNSCSEDTIDQIQFGTLTGKVVIKDTNEPLENVQISTNPVSTVVFTDVNGEFEITEIQVGEYSVQAELSEYITSFEPASVLPDRTSNLAISLELIDATNISPLEPILLTPEDGAKNIATTVNFAWMSSDNDDDEVLYNFELRDAQGTVLEAFDDLKDTVVTVNDLVIGSNYFWQVQAVDGVNDPVQSKISSFETQGIGQNRFVFVKNVNGNNVVYSGNEPGVIAGGTEPDQDVVKLTSEATNSYRPRKNELVSKIAFLRNVGAETHLFTMGLDGKNMQQITATIPVSGFRQNEIDFCWSADGSRIFYPSLNKLYAINNDGGGLEVVYEAPSGTFISEVAANGVNSTLVVKTNDASGYNARLILVDAATGLETLAILEGLPGAIGGIDYSFDGNLVLFTRDVSGTENDLYRRLDSRIFEYNLATTEQIEFDTEKLAGQNDLDPIYIEDEGAVLFVATSNDGVSEKQIVRVKRSTQIDREVIFTNAFMPEF